MAPYVPQTPDLHPRHQNLTLAWAREMQLDAASPYETQGTAPGTPNDVGYVNIPRIAPPTRRTGPYSPAGEELRNLNAKVKAELEARNA